jgi:cytidine deaminase
MTPEYGKGGFSPCGRCLDVIGELFNDDSDEEITTQLTAEGIFFELYQKDAGDAAGEIPEKT